MIERSLITQIRVKCFRGDLFFKANSLQLVGAVFRLAPLYSINSVFNMFIVF